MLKQLLIQNYALIESLDIRPVRAFNVITGETGAGKSIMLGALGLLMGNRVEGKVFADAERKCAVEGYFDVSGLDLSALFEEIGVDYEQESILRREIAPSGRSRAFVNDSPVNLEQLRKVALRLLDIHSQHDTMALGSAEYQLDMLDGFARNSEAKALYAGRYTVWRAADKAHRELLSAKERMAAEYEFNKFQLDELKHAALEDVNEAELEQELERLENAEGIKASLLETLERLSRAEVSVEGELNLAVKQMAGVAVFSEQYEGFRARLESALIEIREVVRETEEEEEGLMLDEERIGELRDRLDLINTLQQKHRVQNVDALRDLQAELEKKVSQVENFDAELEAAEAERQRARKALDEAAAALTETRRAAIPSVEEEVNGLLRELGMPNARLVIGLEPSEPQPHGADAVEFLFSANKGIEPDSLRNVASGGEFSRLMMCFKYVMAQRSAMPTIIFDEIDTGVSGEIAIKMAKMMREMSRHHQVLAISHLPQIAAHGQAHYFVYKDDSASKAVSRIRKLSEEERVEEIAKMLGGAAPSEIAYLNARELLHAS